VHDFIFWNKAMEKALEAKLPNLKLILGDGGNLENIFAPLELSKIYLNFSDPWPKSRHAKRRLTYNTFLETYHKLISSKGEIEFKTDNVKLFEYSVMNFNRHNLNLLDFSVDLHQREEEIITTEYEDKFVALNKPIFYAKVSFKE
jgi:tRNA (guanine-N7-)-methyltransferase